MTMSKPPRSWLQTSAADEFKLEKLAERTVIFEGSAREAAAKYPKNSNVAAALAFATTGLDDTRAVLVADPTRDAVVVSVEFESAAGNLKFEMVAKASEDNAATSADVPFSVLRSLRTLSDSVVVGA